MGKRNKNRGGLVYSTDGGRFCPQCRRPESECICTRGSVTGGGDGIIRIRRETKGRGGKAVTVITGFALPEPALKQVAKDLKQRCGTGGAIKNGNIEIQGDKRETCKDWLESKGHQVKLSGG